MPPIMLEESKVGERIVNDFCMTFSTVNGSGSATANTILLRSLFHMGIPVTGKNIFPSNIQGLPTWYSIRLSEKGYLARVEKDDIVVSMNPSTIAKELEFIVPGGVLFYSDDINLNLDRKDIITYPMPVRSLIKSLDIPTNLREYVANMVYVGIVAQILQIDLDVVYQVLVANFKGKQRAVESNWAVIKAAADWAAENLTKTDRYSVEKRPELSEWIMTDGNTAAALGAIFGGVQFAAWYPITPASSLAESLVEYLPQYRRDTETGKTTYAVIQAEDEIAAIGMAIGAGWGGLRSMTSTSGPGFSLMAEYLGLAYFSEVPLVVFDVQRVGPSTGLPTRTAQGDLTFAYFTSHGDTQYPILLPANVNECFDLSCQAFDLAEQLQTPILVLSDLDLGMNTHMAHPFAYPQRPLDRGKILWEDDFKAMLERTNNQWGRYMDVDGDGIPYRTLIGNKDPRSAYFARGTGHDELTRYSEDPLVWERMLRRLKRKIDDNKKLFPQPVIDRMPGAKFGIVGFGSTDPAIQEARDILAAEGIPTDYLRIRAIPFADEVCSFLKEYDRTYVIELNRDGQMKQLLTMQFSECGSRMRQVSHIDGMAITATWIKETLLEREALEE